VYERQRELLAELVEALTRRAPDVLDIPFAAAWREAPDDAGRVRAVIDQVATLTDPRAVHWHGELTARS
jgi:dGTPase